MTRGNHLTSWGSSTTQRVIPAIVRYEVNDWARGAGKILQDIVWNDVMACPEVRLKLMGGDPRLKDHQEGKTARDWEPVFLHRWDDSEKCYVSLPLEPGPIRDFLKETDVQSGTGKFPNADAAAKAADKHNKALEEFQERAAAENARLRARDSKRLLFDQPLVSVPSNLEAS